MTEQKFFRCAHCGNLVGMLVDSDVTIECCGEPMGQLIANTVEAASEKHLPSVTVHSSVVIVDVGSVPHPMQEDHHISWVYLQSERGGQRRRLNPGEKPYAAFTLVDNTPVAAYAYCNLHGLWKTDIPQGFAE